ncbi:hypothetical protein Bbelb_019870 [Branchiostoma belcheri]|nr:hypothetical protein Bbelb_019870 [Branchiostoma belcheri]
MSFEASRNSGTGLKLVRHGGVVVDWYVIDIGEGDVRFAQLYEQHVVAKEYRPDRRPFQSGHHAFPTMREMGEESRAESRALTILPLVCWQCGETDTLPIPPEKLQEFQCIHPVCQGEKTAKEEAVKEEAVKEEAVKEEAVKEEAVKEEAVKEEAVKEEAVKEEAVKEEAVKEEAVKEDETRIRLSTSTSCK